MITVEPHTGDGVVALGYPDVDYQVSGADPLRPALPSRTSGQIASLRDRAPTGDPNPTINHQQYFLRLAGAAGRVRPRHRRELPARLWLTARDARRSPRRTAAPVPDEAGARRC